MRGMDHGLFTGAVFIDLRKVFDSVDHKILISKLDSYGLKDIELDWSRNYLKDRLLVKKPVIGVLLHQVSHKGQFWALYSLS